MPMPVNERKAELVRLGIRQDRIAEALGVDRSHVHQVLVGKRRSPRVEQAIADAIGRPVDEVFPPRDEQLSAGAGTPAVEAAAAPAVEAAA